ncbi:carboxypeptidase regulatory-like domain-containing protein [Silvibacterium sp.]|uniref:TonB-dependent receptor n=1 Tax=Silvibacterium sp. TaxID=1964179 RepID=UPI0039E5F16E
MPVFAVLLALLLFVPSFCFGQLTVGNLVGTVTTPDGSVLPGASITVTNNGTTATRKVVTNGRGDYSVPDLDPGTYTVEVDGAGFSAYRNTGAVIAAQQTVRIDAHLSVQGANSTVTVTAGAPVIQTDMPSIATTVSSENLNTSSSNLLSTSDATGDSGLLYYTTLLPGGSQAGSSYDWSMYGSRGSEAYYNVDGISSNSALYGNMVGPSLPPFGMIQEVEYSAVDNKAEMGQLLNISVVTKSGTNKFHGDLFDNYSNNAFQARNYFADSVGKLISDDFGADIGGPILRNRLFFYGSGEFLREAEPISINPSVPTVNFRNGDFSSLLNGSNPITIINPYTGQAFANNQIPASMISSAAQTWQNLFYPDPNYGTADNYISNFRGTYPQNVYTNRYYLRSDYQVSQNNTMFARVGYIRSSPEVLDSGLPPSLTGYRVQRRQTWQGVISDTWVLSNSLINVAKVGFTHTFNSFGGAIHGQPLIDELGIEGFPTVGSQFTGIPSLAISDFTSPYQLTESQPTEQTFQLVDQITWQHGSHTVKAGVEYRPMQADSYYNPTFGSDSFTGAYTNFAYADFLLGLPQTTSYTYARSPQYAQLWYLSGFVQDDWKVKPNLTVYLGARYDYNSPAVDKNNIIASFDPKTGAVVIPNESIASDINTVFPSQIPIETAAEAGYPDRSMRNSFKTAIYPRLGFAYRPFNNDNTVIRGGYGIYNDELSAALFSYLYGGPFGVGVSYSNAISGNSSLVSFQHPINSGAQDSLLGAVGGDMLDKNMRNPYVQQFNLTLEQNLGFNTGFRLSYVGTRAAKLIFARNIDQVHASTTAYDQANSPYPNFYDVYLFQNGGYENYNALSAEVNRRFVGGLSFEAGLTWAKNLTDDDESSLPNGIDGGVTSEDAYNLSRQKGNAKYDPRVSFVSNLIWELPFGHGKWLFNQNGIVDRFIGGWKISGAYLAQSGDFLTPEFSGPDPSNTNQFSGAAQRVAKNLYPHERTRTEWFNPAAFATPANGTFGSGAFGTVVGPNMNNVNLALFKTFALYRGSQLEIKGSFTNVLNHTNFGDPDVTITDSSVGQITSTTTSSTAGPRAGLVTARITF